MISRQITSKLAAAVFVLVWAVSGSAQTPQTDQLATTAQPAQADRPDLRRFDAGGTEYLPLAETAAAAQTRREVYFATNRNPIPEAAPTGFGNSVRAETRFGMARLVSESGVWRLDGFNLEERELPVVLAAPEQLAIQALSSDPDSGLAAMGLDVDEPLARLAREAAQAETDVLVFVHGAGHDFESALSTTARLAELYQRQGRNIVALTFTYPTNGISEPLNYFLDRRDAGMSGMAMADGFNRMVRFLGELHLRQPTSRVWFMAHSLGAYATRVAVQSIFERTGYPPRVFDVAFLMGADDDYDTLSIEAKMRPILLLTGEMNVYFASNDALLKLSSIANLRPPIGLRGPREVNDTDYAGTTVHAIDAEAFSAVNDPWRAHGYFTRSPRVIADVGAVISGQSADEIAGRARTGKRTFRLQN